MVFTGKLTQIWRELKGRDEGSGLGQGVDSYFYLKCDETESQSHEEACFFKNFPLEGRRDEQSVKHTCSIFPARRVQNICI